MRTGRPPSWNKEQLRKAIELYKTGNVTITDSCKICEIPETSLTRYLKLENIKITDTNILEFRKKRNEYMRGFYLKHKDTIKKRVSLYKIRHRQQYCDGSDLIKIKLIQHYSSGSMKCAFCEESDMDILTIDHINGGGNAHRRSINKSGSVTGGNFYKHLADNNYPEGYQILCWNCNAKKGINDRRSRVPLWQQWSEAT